MRSDLWVRNKTLCLVLFGAFAKCEHNSQKLDFFKAEYYLNSNETTFLVKEHFPFLYLPLQLLIEIIDASSVITWDFDVCKGDVIFNIYHSKRAPQPPRKDPLATHGITSPAGNNMQLIDKSWLLGQDYSMVESPLTCKEGESVQVCQLQPASSFMLIELP